MRFNDKKSRRQIALYTLNAIKAADQRNEVNRHRWTAECRARWELEQVGRVFTRAAN